jgi:uncharacterized membrane protein YbhN (UPF0104 family)
LNFRHAAVCDVALLAGGDFLMPGAPGGTGIREATLTLLLTGVVPADDALLTAVIFRFVTIIGDFWGILFAWICLKLRMRIDFRASGRRWTS